LERMTARYVHEPFTRRNYDDIHNPLDTFARTCVLKYSDISCFTAKLVAAHPSRGDVRHNSIISSFGESINISNVSNVLAGRAIRFKLPVIIFRLECHVLMGCIFNYPRRNHDTYFHAFARSHTLCFSLFCAGIWEIKVDRREEDVSTTRYFRCGMI